MVKSVLGVPLALTLDRPGAHDRRGRRARAVARDVPTLAGVRAATAGAQPDGAAAWSPARRRRRRRTRAPGRHCAADPAGIRRRRRGGQRAPGPGVGRRLTRGDGLHGLRSTAARRGGQGRARRGRRARGRARGHHHRQPPDWATTLGHADRQPAAPTRVLCAGRRRPGRSTTRSSAPTARRPRSSCRARPSGSPWSALGTQRGGGRLGRPAGTPGSRCRRSAGARRSAAARWSPRRATASATTANAPTAAGSRPRAGHRGAGRHRRSPTRCSAIAIVVDD